MRWTHRIRHFLRDLFQRSRVESELDEEIRFHLQMEMEANRRRGMEPEEARRRALRKFGGVARFKEAARDARGLGLVEELSQDLQFALRSFRRRPIWSVAVLGTVAVGVGAATAIVSTADHVLLRPLPFHDVARVVSLWETDRSEGGARKEVSPGNWVGWRERTTSFAAMGLAEPWSFDLTGDEGPPQALTAFGVTEEFLEALGVEPVVGRGFRPADYGAGAAPVVLLSHELWVRRFGRDTAVVGRTLSLDVGPTRVVGVLPGWLRYPEPADVWAPKTLRPGESEDRRSRYMTAVARLRPGVTMGQARQDLGTAAAGLARDHPETNSETGAELVPLKEEILGPVRPAFQVLLGGVLVLLLVAGVNTANLLLARGLERDRELAVRSALGAGPGRLSRQLFTETAVLGTGGWLTGAGLAAVALRLIRGFAPGDLPRIATVGLDMRALVIAAGLTLLVLLAAAAWPALRLSRPDLMAGLKTGGRTATIDPGRGRLQQGLVATEVGLALVLLIGAGLLGRSFVQILSVDPGFEVENRATVQAFLWDHHPSGDERIQAVDRILERMRALPDVRDAAVVSALPFHPHAITSRSTIDVEGRPVRADGERPRVYTTVASPNYFEVMGIPVLSGRTFGRGDVAGAPPVALVSRTLANRLFPGGDPVGRRVQAGVMGPPGTWEIVGVVGDVRPDALDSPPRAELYVPFAQHGTGSLTFVATTRGAAGPIVRQLEEAIWEVDPLQTVYHAAALEELVGHTLRDRRFHLFIVGSFAGIALLLAIFGVYGVVSFATSRRTAEIGIRMALGAGPRRILVLVMKQGFRAVAVGAAIGLGVAVVAARVLERLQYGVPSVHLFTYAGVTALLLLAAAGAIFVPSRRAASIDPAWTLRAE